MTELQTRVATLRKQVADAVAQATEVLRAQKELEQAQGDVEKSERSATAARQRLEDAVAKLQREKQDLSRAIEADRKDSNKGKK